MIGTSRTQWKHGNLVQVILHRLYGMDQQNLVWVMHLVQVENFSLLQDINHVVTS